MPNAGTGVVKPDGRAAANTDGRLSIFDADGQSCCCDDDPRGNLICNLNTVDSFSGSVVHPPGSGSSSGSIIQGDIAAKYDTWTKIVAEGSAQFIDPAQVRWYVSFIRGSFDPLAFSTETTHNSIGSGGGSTTARNVFSGASPFFPIKAESLRLELIRNQQVLPTDDFTLRHYADGALIWSGDSVGQMDPTAAFCRCLVNIGFVAGPKVHQGATWNLNAHVEYSV